MANRFEQAQATYKDPKSSEFDKGMALGTMHEEIRKKDMYNKEHDPNQYHKHRAEQAKDKATYHEKEAKKHPVIDKPKKGK